MTQPTSFTGLAGKLLIAMPGMGDPRFERSVVFMCAHSPEAAMGLIVNKPTPNLRLDEMLQQLGITPGPASVGRPVHFGGPVETGRGFVLHSADYEVEGATLKVDDAFSMTATLDILRDIAQGTGPARWLATLGYAGWGPGQLDHEIQMNGWLTCDADPKIVFDTPDSEKWNAALKSLGVDAVSLSAAAGRA
ncbi:YqgE/AlgH family protein [Meinhardsimonia xiamenensis]|jgi:putative transcriptional regulator|nr:YqgE/AlgH family protein [Meinhardsimonia xiamenensis]